MSWAPHTGCVNDTSFESLRIHAAWEGGDVLEAPRLPEWENGHLLHTSGLPETVCMERSRGGLLHFTSYLFSI